jgi:hypothetical protein
MLFSLGRHLFLCHLVCLIAKSQQAPLVPSREKKKNPLSAFATIMKSPLLSILLVFLVSAPSTLTQGFMFTAILTRRANKPAKVVVSPSPALLEFNAQMAAIVAEERRDHYYPYVQQTSAFMPIDNKSTTCVGPTTAEVASS